MKRLLALALAIAMTGMSGTLTITNETGVAVSPSAGSYSYTTNATIRVFATCASDAYTPVVYCNGRRVDPVSGWYPIRLAYDGLATVIARKVSAPPKPFAARDGKLSLAVPCSSAWKKIVFGSPTDVQFVDDGASYLYPLNADAVMVQAVGGTVYVSNSTNSTMQVATKGSVATVPCGPVTVNENCSICIKGRITQLFVKGVGTANIMGANE